MEITTRLARVRALSTQNNGIEAERIQALVFFAQVLGDHYDYSFEVHHFLVFSRALQEDIERCAGSRSGDTAISKISQFVSGQILSLPIEEVELAAAWLFYKEKHYSDEVIAAAIQPDETLLRNAKAICCALLKQKSSTLATT